MALSLIIVPFIRHFEGGLSKRTDDAASVNPCPFQHDGEFGWHTNVGVTWTSWASLFGTDGLSAQRFFAMSDTDWNTIFKKSYWDKCSLDQVKSQRIANVVANWVYMSGVINPDKDLQHILNKMGFSLTEDGLVGSATIKAINSADEQTLYTDLLIDNAQYLKDAANYLDGKYPGEFRGTHNLNGWMVRLAALQDFNDNSFKL